MFKNRKSALLAKKSSELTTIRETVSDATTAPTSPSQKIRRLESAAPPETGGDDPFGSSQFSVPASQLNSQRRYLSQRSNLQKSQSVRTSRRMPTNYFESVLLKCQLELDDPVSVVLRCEPITFVRTLRSMLKAGGDCKKNVSDFVHGVEQVSKKREEFRKFLECCQMQSQTSGVVKPIQESVMKMLLCVEFMQEDLIRVLFEYVEWAAQEDIGVNMIGLVLSQIKFIDHSAHGTLVFNKYFEVLERFKSAQLLREAISALQDVIDVSMQNVAFRKLLELFPRAGDLFTVTNVTVFCELSLSGATLRITRQKMVDFVEKGCGGEIYPQLVRFMLKFSNGEVDGFHENIREVRLIVDNLVRNGHDSSVDKYLREIFQVIYQALTVSGVLFDTWVKFCRLLTDEESHMALDLLVLLMMFTINEIKSGTIQKIITNKIKKHHLTISHMKTLTKDFGCVLTINMDCVLDFVELCLKEKQADVCEFGVLSMSYLFSANNLNNRMVLNKLVGFMCEMALINEGQRNNHLISNCMNALSNIYRSYPNDIRHNAHILLKIMDISMDLTLQQYRTAVSLICEAIHVPDRPLNDNETWDSLNIVIKKQLLSNNKTVKKKGVIGVVRLIRHLLKTSTENEELTSSFDSDRTIDTVSDIPTASGREIGNMINLLFTSSNESTDILALCYDELAEMLHDFECTVGKPEKAFIIWLCDVLTNEFQNYFIIEEIPHGEIIQYSKKLCINDETDIENTNAEAYAIAVNITENMLAFNSRYSTMCFFLSMFKLMKVLQLIRYNGNLESINALLGCAIVTPTFYDAPDEQHLVESFEEDVCRQLLDAYFYIANWFRELINAFILQSDNLIHRKVLQRLTAMVKLERRIAALLSFLGFDYYPPVCDFTIEIPRKTMRFGKETFSRPNVTLNASTKTQLNATTKSRSSDSTEFDNETLFVRYCRGFRSMDAQVMQLFRETLLLCHNVPNDKVGECLGLSEYRFLLETFATETEAKGSARLKLDDLVGIIPPVVDNYVKMNSKRREILSSTDPDLQTEYKALTCCSNLSLRLFAGTLNLLNDAKPELRHKALTALEKLATPSDKSCRTEEDRVELILVTELTHKNAFKSLNNAHCLYKFGCALNLVHPTPANPSTIATFCQKFICTHFGPKTGTILQLSQLFQGVFTVVDFPKIKRLTKALSDDLTSAKSDEKFFPGLQRSNYVLLFKELSKAFIKCIQSELRSRRTTVQKFVLWEQSSEILKQFSEVAKHADNSKIYSCYMRYSHTYLKLFQQSGLKTLEDILKVSADRVSHMLSTLQHSTRYLHNICCHSKNTKDHSLAAQIPFIRETVETLIYSVKAVLAANDCASVFWMGNLKNKDLKGDLIVSQHEPAENELDLESESDIEDFLSDDDDGEDRRTAAAALSKGGSEAKSSQSKCF